MSKPLYEITTEYNDLMLAIEEQEGVLEDEQIEALAINEKELQIKSVAYWEVIKSSKSFEKRIDEEIKRLQAMKKAKNTLVGILTNNLLGAVNLFGEFNAGLLTFKTRKSTVCVIEDEDAITKDYKTITVTEKISKTKIKEAIKSGVEVKGAILQENRSLMVK